MQTTVLLVCVIRSMEDPHWCCAFRCPTVSFGAFGWSGAGFEEFSVPSHGNSAGWFSAWMRPTINPEYPKNGRIDLAASNRPAGRRLRVVVFPDGPAVTPSRNDPSSSPWSTRRRSLERTSAHRRRSHRLPREREAASWSRRPSPRACRST